MKNLKIVFMSLLISSISFFFVSCAEISPPTPMEIIKNPLGTGHLYKGMSKEEIVNLWGQPNIVNRIEQDAWSGIKEEWTYNARYPGIPVDYNYLSKSKYLYFEDNVLINWKEEK